MPTEPLISVIIPTYNRASFLREAIDSVAGQTYRTWEIVVADDGSTDGTTAMLAGRDEPIRHVRLERRGRPAITRNRAVDAARGSLIAFLDDDDLWQPDKLRLQVDALADRPDVGLVYTAARILSRDGSLSEPIFADRAPRDGRIFGPLLSECFVHISTTLVRRAEFEAVGGFDETLSAPVEDYDLWLRLARRTGARMVREPLVSIRRHDGCISSTRELAVWRDTLLILGRTRRGGGLGVGERLRVRRSMARAHTRLSVLQAKDPVTRRRHLASALRLNPLQRTGWREVAAVLAARPWRRDSP